MEKPSGTIVFNYRNSDSAIGVCRETIQSLARAAGVTETQYIHGILAQHVAIEKSLPDDTYPSDDEISRNNEAFVARHGDVTITETLSGIYPQEVRNAIR
jgi:hypothetical protein